MTIVEKNAKSSRETNYILEMLIIKQYSVFPFNNSKKTTALRTWKSEKKDTERLFQFFCGVSRRMSGQISAGAHSAAAGAQNVAAAAVQKAQSAAAQAAAQAAAKEVEKQFSNALGSAFGGRRK